MFIGAPSTRPRRHALRLASLLVLVATACAGDRADDAEPATTIATDSSASRTPRRRPAPTTVPAAPPRADVLGGVRLSLKPFVDLPLLTAMASRPDGVIVMTSQTGEVWLVTDGARPELVLDLRDVVSEHVDGSERGLLGAAFHPTDDRLFLYYTDADIDSHIVSYAVDRAGRPDEASVREVMFEEQPGVGHKGGGLVFEPDGTLYIAFGDGGASDGRDAQDYSKVHGSIVRIVPKRKADGYNVPADNPFVGQEGMRPEIWAKGLRNPWGFCRDPGTGDLWVGDVGDLTMEEVNRLPAGVGGQNFGWYFIEGTVVKHEGAPADAVPPVHAYTHEDVGPAVIGGCVYRGAAIAKLNGAYVFADLSGPVFAIGAGDEPVRLDVHVEGLTTGIGIGPDGELYVLTLGAGAFRLVAG